MIDSISDMKMMMPERVYTYVLSSERNDAVFYFYLREGADPLDECREAIKQIKRETGNAYPKLGFRTFRDLLVDPRDFQILLDSYNDTVRIRTEGVAETGFPTPTDTMIADIKKYLKHSLDLVTGIQVGIDWAKGCAPDSKPEQKKNEENKKEGQTIDSDEVAKQIRRMKNLINECVGNKKEGQTMDSMDSNVSRVFTAKKDPGLTKVLVKKHGRMVPVTCFGAGGLYCNGILHPVDSLLGSIIALLTLEKGYNQDPAFEHAQFSLNDDRGISRTFFQDVPARLSSYDLSRLIVLTVHPASLSVYLRLDPAHGSKDSPCSPDFEISEAYRSTDGGRIFLKNEELFNAIVTAGENLSKQHPELCGRMRLYETKTDRPVILFKYFQYTDSPMDK